MSDKTVKKLSRRLNKGTYLRSFSIVIAFILFLILFAALPQLLIILSVNTGLKAAADSINPLIFPVGTAAVCLLVTLWTFLTAASFQMGENAWYTGRLTRKKQCGKRLRFWFRLPLAFKALRLNALLFLLKAMWTIAFLSPAFLVFSAIVGTALTGGIEIYLFLSLLTGFLILLAAGLFFRFIIIQRYFLAPYLIAENPKLSSITAIKQSKNLLEGHIFRIVLFKLKFIPLFLSYLFIIPAIFVHPHYKQCCCMVAKDIRL